MKHSRLEFCKEQFAELIFLPVTVNGKEIPAAFDTGAQITVVTETMADVLGIAVQKESIKGGNNQGKKFAVLIGLCAEIAVGSFLFHDVSVGIIPDAYLEFGTDESGNSFPAKMLLGRNLISSIHWKFDMVNRSVELESGGSLQHGIPMKWDAFPVIAVQHLDEKMIAGFDSGHTQTTLDPSWKNRLGQTESIHSVTIGIGSAAEEQIHRVDCFSIAANGQKISVTDAEIAGHGIYGGDTSRATVLFGIDLVRDAIWEIDGQSGYFALKK